MTQRSRKRASDAEYAKTRNQRYVQARGYCERCLTAPAEQTHHVQRRSNSVNHSVENLRAVCSACHAHIHAEVAESKRDGWIVTTWAQL
jgi:HNH endonuclease